jgi:hypothetical protein
MVTVFSAFVKFEAQAMPPGRRRSRVFTPFSIGFVKSPSCQRIYSQKFFPSEQDHEKCHGLGDFLPFKTNAEEQMCDIASHIWDYQGVQPNYWD